MKIIKRNGAEEVFDQAKIVNAIKKANIAGEKGRISDEEIADVNRDGEINIMDVVEIAKMIQ